jgi:hypothetical protein
MISYLDPEDLNKFPDEKKQLLSSTSTGDDNENIALPAEVVSKELEDYFEKGVLKKRRKIVMRRPKKSSINKPDWLKEYEKSIGLSNDDYDEFVEYETIDDGEEGIYGSKFEKEEMDDENEENTMFNEMYMKAKDKDSDMFKFAGLKSKIEQKRKKIMKDVDSFKSDLNDISSKVDGLRKQHMKSKKRTRDKDKFEVDVKDEKENLSQSVINTKENEIFYFLKRLNSLYNYNIKSLTSGNDSRKWKEYFDEKRKSHQVMEYLKNKIFLIKPKKNERAKKKKGTDDDEEYGDGDDDDDDEEDDSDDDEEIELMDSNLTEKDLELLVFFFSK